MSREYDYKEEYLGTGDLAVYTFDFKIEALAQLLLVILDDAGDEVSRVRGDDTTIIDSVDYDAVQGGGTVTLIDDLETDYTLHMFLANDEPTQPYEFKNKGDLTLSRLEAALDFLGGAVQRLAFLAKRSIKLYDLDDVEEFDCSLPAGIIDATGVYIGVNADRDGLALYTADDIAGEVTNGGPFDITNGMSATDVTDMTADEEDVSSVKYMCEVIRDPGIHLLVDIVLVNLDGVWTLHEGMSLGSGDHGLTFTVTETDGVAQVQVASDGTGTGTLKFKRIGFDAA